MELTEGKDYHLEDGKFVLSREYLLSRGWCCKNGCRNCPYDENGKVMEWQTRCTEVIQNPEN